MNVQELRNGLAEFRGQFASHMFDGLDLAELVDLLDDLNSVARNILDRIDIPISGVEREDSVKVIVGGKVVVKEVGLGEPVLGVPKDETKQCPACNGTGNQTVPVEPGGPVDHAVILCPECYGTGKAPKNEVSG